MPAESIAAAVGSLRKPTRHLQALGDIRRLAAAGRPAETSALQILGDPGSAPSPRSGG